MAFDISGLNPPADPIWALPLEQAPLAFVDLEMTGLDVNQDHIVEICIQKVVGSCCVDEFSTLIHPPEHVGRVTHLHGLDVDVLKGAPLFSQVASRVCALLDGAIWVGHGVSFDLEFIQRELEGMHRPCRFPYYLDTLVLARRAFHFPNMALGALARELGITHGRLHRAQEDVSVLRMLFAVCVQALSPSNARDLWEVRVGQKQARTSILSICQKAREQKIPLRIAYRPCGNAEEIVDVLVCEVHADRIPPRVVGFLLERKNRREFRADRILRVEQIEKE
ncbi:PolC-type DNA polymerase III [Pajaroellobacter abortibovis]|uniref:Exonuclease domain-containing protein n=1 Tax=Pajaroellobacter abortibovis TaxID=1882918 RepID=A0A1L6MUZ0_9BACT|nr:3'-5' exonuclease [Pajaroellobacter abortibovis]APR99332.1 hypothetical protein BCY86_00550 [Pajaroellobacter abortibovis]